MRRWLWLVTASLMFVLVGCAVPISPANESVIQERYGRFSVQSRGSMDQTQAVQGGFVWRRLIGGWQLDLSSPLGSTLARLSVGASGASLQQPGQATKRAASASLLLENVLGASVPVDAIEYWVDGRLPDTAAITDVKRDELDRVVSFKQANWRVRFTQYVANGPSRILVDGQEQGRDIELQLLVETPA